MRSEIIGVSCYFSCGIGVADFGSEVRRQIAVAGDTVEKLIALGFLSSLGAEVDPDPASPHSWANPQPSVTVAYHRDRKERLQPAVEFKDKDSFAEEAKGNLWAEYAYLFEDGRWLACDLHLSAKPWKWKVLSDVLVQTGWKLNGKPVEV